MYNNATEQTRKDQEILYPSYSAVHRAAKNGNLKFINEVAKNNLTYLLAETPDSHQTPVDIAAKQGYWEIVNYIINVTQPIKENFTPLDYNVFRRALQTIDPFAQASLQILIQQGILTSLKKAYKAFSTAVDYHQEEIAVMILNNYPHLLDEQHRALIEGCVKKNDNIYQQFCDMVAFRHNIQLYISNSDIPALNKLFEKLNSKATYTFLNIEEKINIIYDVINIDCYYVEKGILLNQLLSAWQDMFQIKEHCHLFQLLRRLFHSQLENNLGNIHLLLKTYIDIINATNPTQTSEVLLLILQFCLQEKIVTREIKQVTEKHFVFFSHAIQLENFVEKNLIDNYDFLSTWFVEQTAYHPDFLENIKTLQTKINASSLSQILISASLLNNSPNVLNYSCAH